MLSAGENQRKSIASVDFVYTKSFGIPDTSERLNECLRVDRLNRIEILFGIFPR